MISSTPLPFISLVIDIPLTVFLALPFSNKYTAGLCHSGSSLLNACHASTSFFQAQQSSSSSRLKIRGNLTLLIFMEINKLNNPSQLIYITVNQFGGNTLENNKTNSLNKRITKVTPFDVFMNCLLIPYCGHCCQLFATNC